jgi:hypothetical protein
MNRFIGQFHQAELQINKLQAAQATTISKVRHLKVKPIQCGHHLLKVSRCLSVPICIAVLQHHQFSAAVSMIVDRYTTQEYVYIF